MALVLTFSHRVFTKTSYELFDLPFKGIYIKMTSSLLIKAKKCLGTSQILRPLLMFLENYLEPLKYFGILQM
jgi:hypothetical protein